ncbi:hypothetical protein [Mycobacteroides abscessus]|uniref:hypothetical protein n=1 Tax=Mycobacteroides abscessus TaxID=36809 RepID=UPI000927D2D3|nr:hypothetical protein [Mycobacteroides abscessus]WJJ56665.1 hypothetical protein PROPHIBWHA1_50 [Mycobacterium phage prophiBWHA-1]MDB2192117.1 hypothetical protein [Mycobacteroides abscessus subsp. abscessus]SHQ53573.1 Uncharacterised protein [Mycobacteroides abscessus subsp. abscessus]SID01708.1 Uncharacterised protein [Mycobacteroides abscessus subsp. abscessus]SIG86400.1 Uncharacterised protein [Mycobacteroides abscessus subsp. abscessus]
MNTQNRWYPDVKLPDTDTYEEFTVYVNSGEAYDRFRDFCRSLGSSIDYSWNDTHDV